MSGTGLVADDLYLAGHDDHTGRPLLKSPRSLGIGLAGGLLAELMLARRIGLRPDTAVMMTGDHVPRTGPDGHTQLLRLIAAEPEPLHVRDWLLFLCRSAARDIGLRLELAGYLTRVPSRIPGRSRLVPANSDSAFMAVSRACRALDAGWELTAHTVVLAGLAAGCGLGSRLDQYRARGGRSVADAIAWLPPDLRVVIAQTEITVSAAVQSQRT